MTPTAHPELWDILRGFISFKTVATALDLDLFTRLDSRSATLKTIAAELGICERPASVLLTACAALGLLSVQDGVYQNTATASEFLVPGNPNYFGAVFRMYDTRLYQPFHGLTEAVQQNRPQISDDKTQPFDVIAADPGRQRVFTEAMHAFSLQNGQAIAQAMDFSHCRKLLDLGGASGACSIRMAEAWPDLAAVVFDLPGAVTIAREKIEEVGLSGRISTEPGDFLTGPLPADCDTILVSNVLHDWEPETCRFLLRKCVESLSPGGMLIIAGSMLDDDLTGPLPAALTSVIMLLAQKGRCYSWREYTEWLIGAGLERIRRLNIVAPGVNGILIAQKREVSAASG